MSNFGATLRLLRLDAGLTLRALAQRVGVSSAYLSRIEHGHDPVPTTDRLDAIAGALGLPLATLVELADQVGPFVTRYLAARPAARLVFLDIARRDLDAGQLAAVRDFVARLPPGATRADRDGASAGGLRLGSLLSTNRVVLHLSCDGLEDAIEVAAARLARHAGTDARAIAGAIVRREHEMSTAIGNGFGVPHARVPGAPLEAALVTLARPLAVPTPDGRPLRILVVVIGAEGGRPFLDVLAQAARLAAAQAADALCEAREPRRLLARLAQIEERR